MAHSYSLKHFTKLRSKTRAMSGLSFFPEDENETASDFVVFPTRTGMKEKRGNVPSSLREEWTKKFHAHLVRTPPQNPLVLELPRPFENQDWVKLNRRIEALESQLQKILELVPFGAEYEEIEVPADGLEQSICKGKTYREEFPNMFLAIDEKRRAIVIKTDDKKSFIKMLQEIPNTDDVKIVNTFGVAP